MVMPGFTNRATTTITRLLPRGLLMDAVGRYNRRRFPRLS
jgi:hypothetical protein